MTDKYEDIIHLPHHVSKKYPQMPVSDRAAQFIPFMALTGYEDAVEETARLTDRKIDLDETQKNLLDDLLRSASESGETVAVLYFQPDKRKAGGAYNMKTVPFPVSWTVKMKKKQKETQDILSYHSQAAGCSDKARAKASGGRQPIEECGRTGL